VATIGKLHQGPGLFYKRTIQNRALFSARGIVIRRECPFPPCDVGVTAWQQLVGSIKDQVSFAKEPYKIGPFPCNRHSNS